MTEPSTQQGSRPQYVAVASGKGGVGKSVVSANVARQLSRLGKKVLLVDTDLALGNVHTLFGLSPSRTLGDVLRGECQLKDIALLLSGGPVILPAGSGEGGVVRTDAISVQSLFYDIEQFADSYDICLFDTATGISDGVRNILFYCDHVLLVTSPEPTSMTDTYATIKLLAQRKTDCSVSLLVNKVESAAQGQATYAQISHISKKYLKQDLSDWGAIYFDRRLIHSVCRQKVVSDLYPDAGSSQSFMDLAAKIARCPLPERELWIKKAWSQLFHRSNHNEDKTGGGSVFGATTI